MKIEKEIGKITEDRINIMFGKIVNYSDKKFMDYLKMVDELPEEDKKLFKIFLEVITEKRNKIKENVA